MIWFKRGDALIGQDTSDSRREVDIANWMSYTPVVDKTRTSKWLLDRILLYVWGWFSFYSSHGNH